MFRELGDVVIIELSGKIYGEPTDSSIVNTVYEYVKQEKVNFVLDFCNVEWMNSRGLGLCIAAASTLREAGGDLKLACACGKVKELLDNTRMFEKFECFDTRDEAVKSFQAGSVEG